MNIATTIKTPRHHDANRPFGAAPMVKQPPKLTDPDTLTICNDPLPVSRASPPHKYEPLFAQLKPGQAVKCTPDEVGRVTSALRKWLTNHKKPGRIRSIKDYGDGMARVWLLVEKMKVAA